jgi:Holliday junction resolvase
MVNRNYKNGYSKELRIVNKLRERGCLAFRSAGSHSPIDVFGMDTITHEIVLIQSKLGKLTKQEEKAILEYGKGLEGIYMVHFKLIRSNEST